MNEKILGLTQQEVDKQIEKGNVNIIPKTKTKSNARIILGHTFNLFNLYNVIIAGFLIYVGEYLSVFFLTVILMNIMIRSFQEIRAKRIVENLNILISDDTRVIRDGRVQFIANEAIVLGDVLVYQVGDQISVDCDVITESVEVNESNLTGESDPVMKYIGDELLSGSFITSGRCYAVATKVGLNSFAQKITNEARQYEPVQSELMNTFMQITKWCTRIVLPIGVILVYQAMIMRHQSLRMTVLTTSSVLLGLLPKGLVLLTSLSFGVSVFRLAQKRTLVQEIYSIEVLSKVEVLCIDKTGTLTAGEMSVQDTLFYQDKELTLKYMSAYLGNSTDTDSTTKAMKTHYNTSPDCHPEYKAAFSSTRKWGAMSFKGMGTVYLGAPDFLIEGYELPEEACKHQADGARILMFAHSSQEIDDITLVDDLEVYALVVIADPIREDVHESLEFFRDNDVNVKVISGDNINTLVAIASRTGIVNGDVAIDVSQMTTDEELEQAVLNYNVIGRASPYQKQIMIKMLQKNKLRVAMVGDGVNDVLALRTADCSIAMGAGSSAARQAAQIILLDNEFTTMVDVVMEGRLVTNNISRSASMYYLGTLQTLLLAIVSIVMNTVYPFTPLQGSIMSMFVEGMPSSFVTFESNYARPKEGIIPQIIRNTLPVAITMGVMFVGILLLRMPIQVRHTIMYFITIYLSFALVVDVFQPMNIKRVAVLLLSATSLIAVCYVFYRQMYLVQLNPRAVGFTVVMVVISTAVLWIAKKIVNRIVDKKLAQK